MLSLWLVLVGEGPGAGFGYLGSGMGIGTRWEIRCWEAAEIGEPTEKPQKGPNHRIPSPDTG